MTNRQLEQLVIQNLEPLYGLEEAKSLQRYLFRALRVFEGLSEWLLIRDNEAGKDLETDIRKALDELLTYKPVQYVTGKAWFCDFEFTVRPGVLIPRPETEELVYLIRNRCSNRHGLRILDIGTGSGAIAVSLAKLLKDAYVEATDVSDAALSIAAVNAEKLGARVKFRKEDILNPSDGEYKPVFNLIVSNPPYVKRSEMAKMQSNVLDFEPSLALFVNDDQPLIYYDAIAAYAERMLLEDGELWFEINECEGSSIYRLLESHSFSGIRIIKDMHGKDRFACAVLASS